MQETRQGGATGRKDTQSSELRKQKHPKGMLLVALMELTAKKPIFGESTAELYQCHNE